MATKRAIELGRRVSNAKEALLRVLSSLGYRDPEWTLVLRLERAAIAVGEHRERTRRAKRTGRSEPGDRSERRDR